MNHFFFMLFWNNDYSPGLADHMRLVRSAVRPASGLSFLRWMSGTVHRKYTGLPMRIDRNENYFALLYIVRQVTIPYFALQFRRNSPVCWCFEIPCQAQGSVSRMRADPDVLGKSCNTGHSCDSQKYPSSKWILSIAISIIDLNVHRWFTAKLMYSQ